MYNNQYEFSNHLGNVLTAISDKPIPHDNGGTVDYFLADIRTAQDYSAFGVILSGRHFGEDTKHGMNGQEKEREITPGTYSAEFWMYESRLARRWNIDPVFKEYESPYATFANNPIWFVDPNGRDTFQFDQKDGTIINTLKGGSDVLQILNEKKEIVNSLDLGTNKIDYSWKYYGTEKQQNQRKYIKENTPFALKYISPSEVSDIFQFSDIRAAGDAFEFLAKETNVEWGYVKSKDANNNFQFFVTTSHKLDNNMSLIILRDEKLLAQNYTIFYIGHSHPQNTPFPSGLETRKSDIGSARLTKEKYKKDNMIYFSIFIPKDNKYIFYDENSVKEDFND